MRTSLYGFSSGCKILEHFFYIPLLVGALPIMFSYVRHKLNL